MRNRVCRVMFVWGIFCVKFVTGVPWRLQWCEYELNNEMKRRLAKRVLTYDISQSLTTNEALSMKIEHFFFHSNPRYLTMCP